MASDIEEDAVVRLFSEVAEDRTVVSLLKDGFSRILEEHQRLSELITTQFRLVSEEHQALKAEIKCLQKEKLQIKITAPDCTKRVSGSSNCSKVSNVSKVSNCSDRSSNGSNNESKGNDKHVKNIESATNMAVRKSFTQPAATAQHPFKRRGILPLTSMTPMSPGNGITGVPTLPVHKNDSYAHHADDVEPLHSLYTDNDSDEDSETPEVAGKEWPANTAIRSFARSENVITRSGVMIGHRSSFLSRTKTTQFQTAEDIKWVMDPTSPTRMAFDLLGIVMLAYDLFVTPVILAWGFKLEGTILYATIIAVCYWTTDVIMMTRTGFYANGDLEMRPSKIVLRYLKTTMVPDVLFLLLDWVAIIMSMRQSDDIRPARLLRLMRFLNTTRVGRVVDYLERFAYRFDFTDVFQHTFSLLKLVFFILWINHILACLMWALGSGMIGDSDTEKTWVDNGTANVLDSNILYQYTTTLHWAFMQMGTGNTDVVPTNSKERLFGIFAVVLGTLFFSWFVSSLSTTFVTLGQMHAKRDAQVRQLRKFLRQFKISTKMSMLIERQAVDKLSLAKPLAIDEVSALDVLSPKVRADLHVELCSPYILGVAFFRIVYALAPNVVHDVMVECIDFSVKRPAECIFEWSRDPKAYAKQAFLLDYGMMEYVQLPEQSKVERRTAEEVPRRKLIVEPAMWLHWKHVGTAVATTSVQLLTVDVERWTSFVGGQANTRRFAADYALAYHSRLSECVPPESSWPTDLQIAFTSPDEIVSALTRETRITVSMLAVEMLKHPQTARKAVWSRPKNIDNLIEEIESNRCVLTIADGQDIVRVVTVTALALRRTGSDDRILAELGTWSADGSLSVFCRLPGSKQEGSESPSEALHRILNSKLSHFKEHISMGSTPPEVIFEYSHSETYNIKTRYVRTLFKAYYTAQDSFEVLSQSGAEAPEELDVSFEVFGLPGNKKGTLNLYAWLQGDDIESFRQNKEGVADKLKAYMATLDFEVWSQRLHPRKSSVRHSNIFEPLAVMPGTPS